MSRDRSNQRPMIELEKLSLEIVRKAGNRGVTPTELGDYIFTGRHRKRQAYARPAGKVLANLKRKGFVQYTYDSLRQRGIFISTGKKGQP